jgi:polysaccharide export outer membrane protein
MRSRQLYVIGRKVSHFLVSIFLLMSGFSVLAVYGQDLSLDQIELFKNLPRSQQTQLAKQFGFDPSVLDSLNPSSIGQNISEPVIVTPINPNSSAVLNSLDSQDSEDVKKKPLNTRFELENFGYGLFAGAPTTFAPATDIPIPSEYIVGPGDNINLSFFGQTNRERIITVDRTGTINAPEFGLIYVTGLSFQALKQTITDTVAQKNIGLKVQISLGELRSVRIFILGEANRPGSYTVSALSTLTNALFVSGGVKFTGSLRNIQLKRQGKVVATLDLYNVLMQGDTSQDVRILAGDVIFIPTKGKTVGISGAVTRNAIFELKNETSFAEIIPIFGGFLPAAYLNDTKVERIGLNGKRTVIDLNLQMGQDQQFKLTNGDMITVPFVLDAKERIITLEGHLYRPGDYEYANGMTIENVVINVSSFLPNIDLNYALIRREAPKNREIYFEQFRLNDMFNGEKIALQSRDKIYFFDSTESRESVLADDLKSLNYQGDFYAKQRTVSVNGSVKFPGIYPYANDMNVADLLNASGNLDISASESYAVLLEIQPERHYEVTNLNIASKDSLEHPVEPEDILFIFSRNGDRDQELAPVLDILSQQDTKAHGQQTINIEGQVKYPGTYPYSKDMTLSNLIMAAGGLKSSAYLGVTEVSRFQSDNKRLATREIVTFNLEQELASPTFTLQPKDVLLVKRIPDWFEEKYVDLVGEFKFPGRYLIKKGEVLSQVITRAGGLTDLAYPGGAVFLRESVAIQQRIEIRRLEVLLQKQLEIAVASKAISSLGGASPAIQNITRVVDAISETNDDGLGRIAIDLDAQLLLLNNPVELFSNDRLAVPRKPSTVQIIGEVNRPTAHVFDDAQSLSDYLELAGGVSQFAKRSNVYIIRADGRIFTPKADWFTFTENLIKPGDTIVVPFDVSLRDNLGLWQQVTSILYNSAVALAAVRVL